MEANYIRHYLNYDGIRLTVADTSSASAEVMDIHQLPPVSAAILSKAMTGAAILANDFKNHEGVSFKWVTGSPLGNIFADAYDGHFVRGYMDNPQNGEGIAYTYPNEAKLINENGLLYVTRYSLLKMPYTSTIRLSGGDMADSLTEYLTLSEQTHSAVFLYYHADLEKQTVRSGGYLAQLLPLGNRQSFDDLFHNDKNLRETEFYSAVSSLTALIEKGHFELLKEFPLTFQCSCSEERIRSALLRLPSTDRESLLEDPFTEFACHYCGKKYQISREVLKKWFQEEREVH